jgi:sigma-E factor negative regulatory protein RseC
MIEERVTVTASDGEFAQVSTQRVSTCGACGARGACGTSALAKVLGSRRTSVRVLNPIGARPGDEVIIGLQESALTRASFAFYMVPLLSLILFAILGKWLAGALQFGPTESGAILGGLFGLAAGMVWLRGYAGRISQDHRHQAVILRRTNAVSIIHRSLT